MFDHELARQMALAAQSKDELALNMLVDYLREHDRKVFLWEGREQHWYETLNSLGDPNFKFHRHIGQEHTFSGFFLGAMNELLEWDFEGEMVFVHFINKPSRWMRVGQGPTFIQTCYASKAGVWFSCVTINFEELYDVVQEEEIV